MRYLPNKNLITAKPYIFCQLCPGIVPFHTKTIQNEEKSVIQSWSYFDFLYKCDLKKHLEYLGTEGFKRNLVDVKVAYLKLPNSEHYTLNEAVTDARKCDKSLSICGVTLGILLSLLESAPTIYNPKNYEALSRKVFSIQLKYFNPESLGFIGDIISKYTVNKYLMNYDKKLIASYNERSAEIRYLYMYPTIAAVSALIYLVRKRNRVAPETAKM